MWFSHSFPSSLLLLPFPFFFSHCHYTNASIAAKVPPSAAWAMLPVCTFMDRQVGCHWHSLFVVNFQFAYLWLVAVVALNFTVK
jgi:hypothetical protein